MSARAAPTVIVSRTVQAKDEDAFGIWVTSLITAAYRTPGYVSAGIERPNATHPGEWLVVYSFDSGPSLDAWLVSETRQALIEEGRDLFDGEAVEQIVAGIPEQENVRVVSSYQLRDGVDTEHILLHQRLLNELQKFEGFIQRDLLDAVPGVQPETVVTLTFDTRENLLVWVESNERQAAVKELEALTVGDLTTSILGGFGGWFPTGDSGSGVPKWKQAVVVFIALYPTVIVTSYLARCFWPDLNLLVAIFVGNIISIAILTWILMPFVTSKLAGWLRR